MNNSPKYWHRANKYLSKKDKVMKNLIKKYSEKTLTTRKDIFFSLCKIKKMSGFNLLRYKPNYMEGNESFQLHCC